MKDNGSNTSIKEKFWKLLTRKENSNLSFFFTWDHKSCSCWVFNLFLSLIVIHQAIDVRKLSMILFLFNGVIAVADDNDVVGDGRWFGLVWFFDNILTQISSSLIECIRLNIVWQTKTRQMSLYNCWSSYCKKKRNWQTNEPFLSFFAFNKVNNNDHVHTDIFMYVCPFIQCNFCSHRNRNILN